MVLIVLSGCKPKEEYCEVFCKNVNFHGDWTVSSEKDFNETVEHIKQTTPECKNIYYKTENLSDGYIDMIFYGDCIVPCGWAEYYCFE